MKYRTAQLCMSKFFKFSYLITCISDSLQNKMKKLLN
jgi:hypothetical protein